MIYEYKIELYIIKYFYIICLNENNNIDKYFSKYGIN